MIVVNKTYMFRIQNHPINQNLAPYYVDLITILIMIHTPKIYKSLGLLPKVWNSIESESSFLILMAAGQGALSSCKLLLFTDVKLAKREMKEDQWSTDY